MKKKTKTILWVIGVILAVGLIGFVLVETGTLQMTGLSPTFTPIYCNDYEFTCCVDVTTNVPGTFSITPTNSFLCDTMTCTLTGTISSAQSIGSQSCSIGTGLLGIKYWACKDSHSATSTNSLTLNNGQRIWTNPGASNTVVTIVKHDQRLDFTGRAGSSQGVPVLGADRCTFHPEGDKVYTTTGTKISTTSYTVPVGQCVMSYQSGDRHICGNKEEECTTNTDCSGHTYGNKECSGRTLKTYGCTSFGTPLTTLEVDVLIPQDNDYSFGHRCEVISSQQVQCCGDTDCGSSYACDKTSFTCKPANEVKCSQNTDCGVSQICDWTTKQLKTPKCNNPGTSSSSCGYSTTNVDCCLDTNCPSNYFCNAERHCQVSITPKVVCPYECCISESAYVDKPCAGNLFCNNHACSTIPPEPCIGADCDLVCQDKFGGLVSGSLVTTEGCYGGFLDKALCNIGLTKKQQKSECSYDYTIVIIMAILILVLGILALVLASKRARKSKFRGGRY